MFVVSWNVEKTCFWSTWFFRGRPPIFSQKFFIVDFDVISRYIHCIHTQHVYARSLRSLATCIHVDMSCRHMSTCIRLRVDMYTRIRLHVYIIRVVMSSIHYTCRRVVVALSLRSFATCIHVDLYTSTRLHVDTYTSTRLRRTCRRVDTSTLETSTRIDRHETETTGDSVRASTAVGRHVARLRSRKCGGVSDGVDSVLVFSLPQAVY